MITTDVQMVQTRSLSHEATWAAQDEARQQTQAHIATAQTSPDDRDKVWAMLWSCNVTLSLGHLLDLVSCFWDRMIRPTNSPHTNPHTPHSR